MRDVGAYLERIGYDGPVAIDLDTLTRLQLAHLQAVPFEALEVFAGRPVHADDDWVWTKVVERRRGGWCFEANGAFALLLEGLGFEVRRLGAAVLLAGPATAIDHLVLEVMLDEPYLVEVGFGDNAPITPLPLQRAGPIETVGGTFELLDCPEVPWRVIINEAIDLAHMFGAEQSHRYVNGVLDRLARSERGLETSPEA